MTPPPKTGPASFGYERKGGKFVAHPTEAPVRCRIFELFAEHQRKKTVAEILNAEGHTTRAGAMFTAQTIGRLLTEEAVTGIDGEVEALISQELWDRCQTILEAQRRAGGAKRTVTHLFSGFVHCGCGQKMYVPSGARKYVCPDCREKISADDLERVFRSQLKGYAVSDAASSSQPDLHDLWSSLLFKQKRAAVEAIVSRIDVADRNVTCHLYAL